MREFAPLAAVRQTRIPHKSARNRIPRKPAAPKRSPLHHNRPLFLREQPHTCPGVLAAATAEDVKTRGTIVPICSPRAAPNRLVVRPGVRLSSWMQPAALQRFGQACRPGPIGTMRFHRQLGSAPDSNGSLSVKPFILMLAVWKQDATSS